MHRIQEVVSGRVGESPGQFVLGGERDGVDHEIEPAPLRLDPIEHRIEGGLIGDIRVHREGASNAIAERFHPLAEGFPLIGEGKLGARVCQGPRNPPRDGFVVRDAQDQAPLALHHISHRISR